MKKIIYLFTFLFIFSFNNAFANALDNPNNKPTNNNYSTSRTNPQKFANQYGYAIKKGGVGWKTYKSLSVTELKDKLAEYQKAISSGDEETALKLKSEIADNGSKVYEFYKDKFYLSNIIKELQMKFKYIPHNLTKIAIYLLGIFTVLEMMDYLMANPTKFPIVPIFKILVKYACLRFLITHWFDLIFYIDEWMKKIATTALAGQGSTKIPFSPDAVWDFFTQPLRDSISDVSWFEPFKKIFYLLGSIPAFLIAGLLTLDLFMARLEAGIILGFGIIVIPFMAWKNSGMGTIANVIRVQFSKLMIMYFFLGLWAVLNPSIAPFSFATMDSYGFVLLFKYTLILFFTRMLIGKSIAIAGALFGGGSGMFGAKDVTAPLTSMATRAIGVASTVFGLTALAKTAKGASLMKNVGSKADRMASASKNSNKES